ncbi:hypothetical protein Nepgr_003163 [Nepenthes gracilis]|uniref:Uncharacterized protein n=1 Tax=Nepenthes gracilis TaxID=150966 RepID=A0AAD3RZ41_NEPGR|nr:hypothetical protein Nepgr_003163 [Nepenthes gracilis]
MPSDVPEMVVEPAKSSQVTGNAAITLQLLIKRARLETGRSRGSRQPSDSPPFISPLLSLSTSTEASLGIMLNRNTRRNPMIIKHSVTLNFEAACTCWASFLPLLLPLHSGSLSFFSSHFRKNDVACVLSQF